jgi:RND superfamily putative drug exporter
VGLLIGGRVTDRLEGGGGAEGLESVDGAELRGATSDFGTRITAIVDGYDVRDPRLRKAVEDARADLKRIPGVGRVADPYAVPLPALVAEDRRALAVAVDLSSDPDDFVAGEDPIPAIERRLRAIADDLDGVDVTLGGSYLLQNEVNAQTERDTQLGEAIALPATLIAMIFVFGGLVAAGVPFLGALVSISGGLLTLYGFSFVLDIEPSVLSVTTVLGLGLAIDYSLLMVSRFREERAAGLDPPDAIARTSAIAGRTILFSGLTVAISICGLFVFPDDIFRSIAAAGLGVAVVAVSAALTLTPALLGMFAKRVTPRGQKKHDHWGPSGREREAQTSHDGPFARLARAVQRRPIPVALGAAALLIAAGIPFLNANFQNSAAPLLPVDFESRQYAEITADRFAGQAAPPVAVVYEGDAGTLQRWADRWADERGVDRVGSAEQLNSIAVVELSPTGGDDGRAGKDLVRRLREDRPPGGRSWVTGNAAITVDFTDSVAAHAPYALGIVALAVFVLLFALTGSILVPLKALVMNVLSLTASFGALVLIFQDGHGADLLGFTPSGGLETWVPVIVFAFAFGLSMDYEVFLISRIKELYDGEPGHPGDHGGGAVAARPGLPNDEAVAVGLQRSGRIITSAALLLVIVFCGFAAGKMLGIKELGVAMAIAVTVDATVVRCLLVPATMTLLGRANWWAPAPLRRLHARFGLRESVSASPPALVPAAPAQRSESLVDEADGQARPAPAGHDVQPVGQPDDGEPVPGDVEHGRVHPAP